MIRIEQETLTESELESIERWLINPTRALVGKLVRQRISALQAEAANAAISNPSEYLSTGNVSVSCKRFFTEAAQWEIFLAKLTELTAQDHKYRTIKLIA